MLVGLISDTHDRLPMIEKGLRLLLEHHVSALIHPGDVIAPFAARALGRAADDAGVPLYITYGNNDGERLGLKKALPQIQDGPLLFTLDGTRILVHHFIDWCAPPDIDRADVIVTGHTHAVTTQYREGKLFANPGECCGWVNGRCTVAILDTGVRSVEVFELAD